MIDLIIDCRMLNNSGIGVYIQRILKELSLGSFSSFKLICYQYQKEELTFVTNKSEDFIIFKAKPFSIKEQFEFLMIPRCNVLWVPHINIPFQKFRCKYLVVTIHDVFHLANKKYYHFFVVLYFKIIFQCINIFSDNVITVSEFSKEEICKFTKINRNKIEVIYNGLNKLTVEKGLQIDLPKKYILFVGNVKPHKNMKALVTAFDKVSGRHPEYKLIIVGKKEGFFLNDESLRETLNNNKVITTGLVTNSELASYFQNCQLFVFPSLYEGFGLPILEAMQFNKPILSSSVASMPEIAGDSINYFDPFLESDLEGKLNQILSNIDFYKEKVDYTTELSRFDWNEATKAHLRILKRHENTSIR